MKDILPVIVVFVLIIIGGLFFVTRNSNNSSQEASVEKSRSAAEATSNIQTKLYVGDVDSKATVVEYFDYKCPSCNQFHRTTGQEIDKAYISTGLAKYEVRLTPIIGPDSANAARGAYCANDQNVFNDYHETVLTYMYDNFYKEGNFSAEYDNILTTSKISEITSELNIDQDTFKICIDSDRFNPNLDANLNAAADDEIRGTPGFAVGEQSFVGGQPFSVFKTLIDIELRN